MKEVLASAAESELASTYYNAKEACPEIICLEELGHPQPPTPIVTDNSTAVGIANDTVKQKRSKAIDMRYYWLRDRVRQGQFYVIWQKGVLNLADYFTKHHPEIHHIAVRSSYLHVRASPDSNTQNSRSKNYFEALYEREALATPTADPFLFPTRPYQLQPAGGEGVLLT
jgi:hypothetical protein